jgi:integrase
VFTNERGGSLDGRAIEKGPYQQALQRAGLPHSTLHTLRHTAAPLIAERRGAVKEIQGLLGHSNPQITNAFYIKYTDPMGDSVAEKMDKLFGRNTG